jgi:serine/threonine protein kinase/tetratricopeptide (TPR) repeat protein
MIGTHLGSYKIVEEIGRGGMAVVYRAHQPSVDRFVAIKVIEKDIAADPFGVESFQREARLIARLEHVHILPVYDFDGGNVPPYIVMRYLDGGTLKDILQRGQLPLSDIAYLFGQIASALDYSHRQGIVHRDIKPSNILIDREGNAFVSDFGIARMVTGDKTQRPQPGIAVGTPDYMSPEQVNGEEDIDHRADVYALGVLLFRMLTNRLPFEASSPIDVMMKHLNESVPSAVARNPALPPAIDRIVARAMAKAPGDRYPSVAALSADFSTLTGGMHSNVQVRRAANASPLIHPKIVPTPTEAPTVLEFNPSRTESRSTLTEQNKLVTTLYLNAAQYTALLAEKSEVDQGAVGKFIQTACNQVNSFGGKVVARNENTLLALWGTIASYEDDAENALRAALSIRTALQEQLTDWVENEPLPLRVGIDTGIALLKSNESTGELTASGSAIAVATRLAEHAEGTILITQDTFRVVQGAFDFRSDEPLKVRGRKEDVPTYRVVGARRRAFRFEAQNVYGIETAMIGRRGELEQLQDAFEEAIEESRTRIVTVLATSGMGKSRLLYEFARWTDLHPTRVRLFRGRATSTMMQRPYALLRDMLSSRFEILESDSLPVVCQKLESGIAELTGAETPDMAHLIGYLIGFDLPDSPVIQALRGDPGQLVARGRAELTKLLKLTAQKMPMLLQIEDIHFADEISLSWLSEFTDSAPELPLMIACFARPDLLERLPGWGGKQKYHTTLTLKPLSKRECRALVDEVLKRLPEVPTKLRDVLVEQAGGSPYFIEETIKMLIDDRVIVMEGAHWRVEESRLDHLRVPPTLFALLQVRLDTLLYPEKLTLQRAAVVGRTFYDTALSAINAVDETPISDLAGILKMLVERDFIAVRSRSSFEGSVEYVFSQNMLRDAIYSTLLDRQIKTYHAATADWLLSTAGERLDEYLIQIADHYENGGEPTKAAEYLHRAGLRALNHGVLGEALQAFEKALALLPSDQIEERMRIGVRIGEVLLPQGEYDAAHAALQNALEAARSLGDTDAQADALSQLGNLASEIGQYSDALAYLEQANPLAANPRTLGRVQWSLSVTHWRTGNVDQARHFAEMGLTVAHELADPVLEILFLNMLGIVAMQSDLDRSDVHFQEALVLARRAGHRGREATILGNLGVNAYFRKNIPAAIEYHVSALALERDMGNRTNLLYDLSNLAGLHILLNAENNALPYLIEMIQLARRLGHAPFVVDAVVLMGKIKRNQGDLATALTYFGGQWFHPTFSNNDRDSLAQYLAEMRTELGLSEAEVQAGLEKGRDLDIDAVIDTFLREHGVEPSH